MILSYESEVKQELKWLTPILITPKRSSLIVGHFRAILVSCVTYFDRHYHN